MTDFSRFWVAEQETEKQSVIQSWSRLLDILARIDERDRWLRQQRIKRNQRRWEIQKSLQKEIDQILP